MSMIALPASGIRAHSPEAMVRRWLDDFDYAALLDTSATAPRIPFVERLDWQGRVIETGYRRMRVMGRQVYTLCHAAIGGHVQALEQAPVAARALMDHGVGPDGQFLCRLAPDGCAIDRTADLYDIAFGLFAMAWWYRLSGDERALAVAGASIRHLWSTMRSPSGHGFITRAGQTGGHAQNPHMHLFEAAICLASFTDRPIFRQLADELFALAEDRLINPADGTIAELFDNEWRPAASGGVILIEPGHQYEWVWLLHRYAGLASCHRAYPAADRLFAFALRHGHDDGTQLVLDGVDSNGGVIAQDLRIWPNTEFLKAQIVMRERLGNGPGFDDVAIGENVGRIMAYFLSPAAQGPAAALRPGLWIDHLQSQGLTPRCDHVPASTFYHIVFAFTELTRFRYGAAQSNDHFRHDTAKIASVLKTCG